MPETTTTPEEAIALATLQHFAGVFYTATPHMQQRVIQNAAKAIKPMIDELVQAAARELSANPS